MIREHLYNCPEFVDEYSSIDVVQNYQLIWERQNFLDDPGRLQSLSSCDIFIHQPLNDSYAGNATSTLLPYLKPSTKILTIPYVWNTAFWPLPKAHLADMTDNLHVVSKPVIKNKGVITNLVDQGLSDESIIELYLLGKIDFKYKSRWDKIITILRIKEQHTDVKVVNFILENYKKIKLFADTSHPTSILTKYMTDQLLQKLNFSNYSYAKDLTLDSSYTQLPYS